MRSEWPCRVAPEMWFSTDRRELAQAVHACVRHCPRLEECGEVEAHPVEGVLAGLLYNNRGEVHGKQPQELPCGGCIPATPNRFTAPRPDPRPGCGDARGFYRHRKRGERSCHPCAAAYNADRTARRRAKRAAA